MKKRKIIRNVIIGVIVAIVLFLVGCYTDVINLNKKEEDVRPAISVEEMIARLNVQEYEYYEREKNVEALLLEKLGIFAYEHIGYTDCQFDVEGVSGDTYGVYNVSIENVWYYYLIPEKDGKSLPCVYNYNDDGSLTLMYSGGW